MFLNFSFNFCAGRLIYLKYQLFCDKSAEKLPTKLRLCGDPFSLNRFCRNEFSKIERRTAGAQQKLRYSVINLPNSSSMAMTSFMCISSTGEWE